MSLSPEEAALDVLPGGAVKDNLKAGLGYYRDPSKMSSAIKGAVPDQYKGYYEQAEAGAKKAAELKRMADEAKMAMIEKALEPLIAQVGQNPEGLTKDECASLVKMCLEQIGQQARWNQTVFDTSFNQFDA